MYNKIKDQTDRQQYKNDTFQLEGRRPGSLGQLMDPTRYGNASTQLSRFCTAPTHFSEVSRL